MSVALDKTRPWEAYRVTLPSGHQLVLNREQAVALSQELLAALEQERGNVGRDATN